MSFAYLPLFTGDYRRDTAHLTPLKHGIYLLLLMHCWDQKGPVPLDEQEAAGICNCRSSDEIESLRYVLAKYFTCAEDGWYNHRMQAEIERSESISRARSEAGRRGYHARSKQLPSKRHAIAKQVPKPKSALAEQLPESGVEPVDNQAIAEQVHLSPSPSPDYPQTSKTYPAFDAFWDAYPHFPQRSSKAKSRQRWIAMKLESVAPDVMGALAACLAIPAWTKDGRTFVGAAEVWLNKRLWEQEAMALTDSLIESIASDPRCQ